jgi:hypothetical protein
MKVTDVARPIGDGESDRGSGEAATAASQGGYEGELTMPPINQSVRARAKSSTVRRAMPGRRIVTVIAAVASCALMIPSVADAATGTPAAKRQSLTAYSGSAWGSRVKVGHLANSGKTATVPMCTTVAGRSHRKTLAGLRLGTLGRIGAVHTSTRSANDSGTNSTRATSTTATTSLLGVVRFSALRTTATMTHGSAGYDGAGSVHFVDLRIAGRSITATPGRGMTIRVPGLITVELNVQHQSDGLGLHRMSVTAMRISIQPNHIGLPRGTIVIGHADAALHEPTTRFATGMAYGTRVHALGVVKSVDTAPIFLPCGGTAGARIGNSTAALHLPGRIRVRVVHSHGRSWESDQNTNVITRSQVAGVHLLGNAIVVSAITATAKVQRGGGALSSDGSGATLLGLKINGRAHRGRVHPNTAIDVLGLGTIYLNRVVTRPGGVQVIALQVVLGRARSGLPKGAVINVGFAQAGVRAH